MTLRCVVATPILLLVVSACGSADPVEEPASSQNSGPMGSMSGPDPMPGTAPDSNPITTPGNQPGQPPGSPVSGAPNTQPPAPGSDTTTPGMPTPAAMPTDVVPMPGSGGAGPDGTMGPIGTGGAPTVPAATGGAPVVTGGTGGTPTQTGGAGTGGSPVLPTDSEVLFSEDFEGQTVGQRPTGWDDFVGWQANNPNNTPTAENFAVVDSEQAFESSNAIHFKGGSNPAQITRALPQGTNRLYVSARVYMTRQLGENPGANHETLIAIRGEPGSANNEIRFGEIKGVIGTNEVPSDNISPLMDQWGMGPAIPANTWACFEVAFLGDQAQHELHAWVDDVEVHSITAPDQWQNGAMPATWMDGKFLEVVFGWHSFSSQNIDVWMDDIVVATERQGCP